MKRRLESDQPETRTLTNREGPEVDVLRMQVQASFQEPPAGPEQQRGPQEESTFRDQIYDLLQDRPGEREPRGALGDWPQQSAHREPLPSAQHEAPFPQAAEASREPAKEPVDEARCHQIVEQLLNPQEKKRLPTLTSEELHKIGEIVESKRVQGVIDEPCAESVLKQLRRKFQKAKRYEENREILRAKRVKRYEENRETLRAKYEENRASILANRAHYREENRASILAKKAQYREENKETLRAKQAKRYEKNKVAILAKKAQYYEENKDYIRAKQAEYYEENKGYIRAKQAEYSEENKEAIRVQRAEYRKRLQDPHERVAWLERTLQNGQEKHDQKRATLEHEIQSLHQQGLQDPVSEHQARLHLLEEKLTQMEHQWHVLRAKKQQALAKAQRLVAIHGECLALLQQAHPHAQPQEAPRSPEFLPSWQALEQPEASHFGAVAHETPSFEEIYQQLSLLLQAPHQADQLQALEHRQREYQAIETQLDEELESLLASFQEPDPFQQALPVYF
jgi:hypothetical protein